MVAILVNILNILKDHLILFFSKSMQDTTIALCKQFRANTNVISSLYV